MLYRVEATEDLHTNYYVEAETPEEAKDKVLQGEYTAWEVGSSEYFEVDDVFPAEEIPKTAKRNE